jgi:uncharacterized protein YehS (DUF1456 family)
MPFDKLLNFRYLPNQIFLGHVGPKQTILSKLDMTNNDVIRRIRYLFHYSDVQTIALFKLADYDVSAAVVSTWLKKDDDPLFEIIPDKELAIFLNGLIIEKRGKRDDAMPEPEDPLSNNMILRKLKIALDLKADDILDLFKLVDVKISKHELSAFFRNPDHKSFRLCMDQYLRGFLNALQTQYKNKSETSAKKSTEQ